MRASGPALAGMAVVVTIVVGCADDGNDVVGSAPVVITESTEPPSEQQVDEAMPTASDGEAPAEPDVEPTGVVVSVIALDNSFRPDVVEVAVGDMVEWENRGLNEHNVLRVEGDDWGVEVTDFQPGAVYSHVFTEPGEYRYYCSIHGNTEVGMVGTILVRG